MNTNLKPTEKLASIDSGTTSETRKQDLSAKVAEEVANRSVELFEPDFNVYADRGANCVKWD
jgi:hypothetical protein